MSSFIALVLRGVFWVLASIMAILLRKRPKEPDAPTKPLLIIKIARDEINALRKSDKQKGLVLNDMLVKVAYAHAQWMAKESKLSHTGDGESSSGGRIREAGYHWSSAGENIAFGFTTVQDVVDGWYESLGHRKIMLGNFKDVGIGYADADNGTRYWASVFANPIVLSAKALNKPTALLYLSDKLYGGEMLESPLLVCVERE